VAGIGYSKVDGKKIRKAFGTSTSHLREHPDRRGCECEGAQRDHGVLDDRDDVRHLRPPDARRTGRGGGYYERLSRNAYLARLGEAPALKLVA
jgi:hypothetical protein